MPLNGILVLLKSHFSSPEAIKCEHQELRERICQRIGFHSLRFIGQLQRGISAKVLESR